MKQDKENLFKVLNRAFKNKEKRLGGEKNAHLEGLDGEDGDYLRKQKMIEDRIR